MKQLWQNLLGETISILTVRQISSLNEVPCFENEQFYAFLFWNAQNHFKSQQVNILVIPHTTHLTFDTVI